MRVARCSRSEACRASRRIAPAGDAGASPGDYVQIAVTAAYSPIFPGFSVIGLRGASSISATSWMRLE